jgi:hypothetical protein
MIHAIAAHVEIPVLLGRTASMESVYARQVSLSVTEPVLMSAAMNLTAAPVRKPAQLTRPVLTEYVRSAPSIFVLTDIAHTQAAENIVTMYSYDQLRDHQVPLCLIHLEMS